MKKISFLLISLALGLGLTAAFSPSSLAGTTVKTVKSGEIVDLASFLSESQSKDGMTMLIFGTYAADFNAVEYAQRLRYYLPQLQERSIGRIGFILNSEAEAAEKLVDLVDLETTVTSDASSVELLVDPTGAAGRVFGVGRGWIPDNDDVSPYLKLFGMLWGLGAWATLPAVIGGYIGNPFVAQPWIEDALAVGQKMKRWPDNALEINETTGTVEVNKFSELPLVGSWRRRPLELATLRLQNMIDISIKNWKELAPNEDALKAGVLTQLGGCVIVDHLGTAVYEWKDPGICAVANFEDILKKVPPKAQ